MSYNGSGTYVPPAGQPVATGTVIQSATFNTLVTDIGNTFNIVLPRDGQAPMQGQLKITDGTSAIPGIAFNSEASSGIFRPSTGVLALSVSGVESLRANSAGRLMLGTTTDDGTNKLQVNGSTKITGAFNTTGATSLASTLNVTGATTLASTLAVTGTASAGAFTTPGNVIVSGSTITGGGTGYTGFGSPLVANYTGNGTQFGLVLKPTTSTTVTNAITFLSSASTPGAGIQMNSIEHLSGDSGCNLSGVWKYQGVPLATTSSSISGTASNVTGVVAIANGGTGQTTGPLACNAIGAVQQGTGVGQGTNVIKLGWGSAGGGLKCTVDATDQGYVPFSSTNPGSGTTTLTGNINVNNGTGTALTVNGSANVQYGMSVYQQPTYILGGGVLTGLGGTPMIQVGSTGGVNTCFDYQAIQTRNNGAAATLSLNYYGGLVQVGSGGLNVNSNNGIYTSGPAFVDQGLYARANADAKIGLYRGGSTNEGWIGASTANNYCFIAINAGNTAYRFAVDNSGNATAWGNVSAYSDESLKKNWRPVAKDFVTLWAGVKHGVYDRIDTDITQVGASAQSVQKVMPEAVTKEPDGKLSLNYGGSALVASIQLAQEVMSLRERITQQDNLIQRLLNKVGLV